MNKIFEELQRIADRNRDHSRSIRDLAMLDLNARLEKLEPSEPAAEGEPASILRFAAMGGSKTVAPELQDGSYWNDPKRMQEQEQRPDEDWEGPAMKQNAIYAQQIADLKQQLAQKDAELADVKKRLV